MVVLGVLLLSRVWLTRGGTVAGIGDDPTLFIWYMRWTPWALAHGQDPLITHSLLAPDGANLMWNTSVILPSLLLWPVTALFGPQWSYDLLLTLAPALSGLVAYLALRRHASFVAALAGAVLYGFSPELVAQSQGHPMVTLAVFPPLAMLLIEDILRAGDRRTRLRRGGLLGAAAAAQLLTGTEMLAITVITAAAGLAVLALLQCAGGGRARCGRDLETMARLARRLAEGLGAAAVAGLVLGALPLAVLLAGPYHVSGSLQVPDVYIQDLAGLVVPGPFQLVTTDRTTQIASHFSGNAVEVGGYLGVPLIAVAVLTGVTLWRRPAVRWAVLTTLVVVLLALGPHLHVDGHLLRVPLPWRLLGHSLLASLLPARIMVVAFLPLALLVAVGIDAALAQRRPAVRVLATVAAALVLVSLLPRATLAQTPEVAPFFTGPGAAAGLADGSTALLSPQSTGYSAMLDQEAAGLRFRITGGGVFAPGPRFGPAASPLTDELRAAETDPAWTPPAPDRLSRARRALDALGAGTVVVAPQPQADHVVAFFTALLGAPPQRVEGVFLWPLGGVPTGGGQ